MCTYRLLGLCLVGHVEISFRCIWFRAFPSLRGMRQSVGPHMRPDTHGRTLAGCIGVGPLKPWVLIKEITRASSLPWGHHLDRWSYDSSKCAVIFSSPQFCDSSKRPGTRPADSTTI